MLPDLRRCAVSGEVLDPGEVAFLLPTREGFISLATYNDKYARSSRGFIRLEPGQLPRWRTLLRGSLLDYPQCGFNERDTALLVGLAQLGVGDVAARPVASAGFLIGQWGISPLADLGMEREN
jgi:hypothetical protein